MKKKLIMAIAIIVAIILLIPIPLRLKDGGTVKYQAILYSISDVHRFAPTDNDVGIEEGIIIEILGMEVFNNVTPTKQTSNPTEDVDKEDEVSFHAKVLEVHDKYLLVEPLADSNESKSSDKIEIALKEKESWPIPAVDDLVKVVYDGNIMETYPARLGKVYRVEILTIIPTEDEPQPGGNVVDDWGLNVSAIDITPSGLKLVVVNSIDNPTAFGYGSYYWLEQYVDNEWIKVEYAPQEHDVGWTMELYMLKPNDITTIGINWEWLYGELPAGHYRVGKNIDNFIQSQKGESRAYYVEFVIGN